MVALADAAHATVDGDDDGRHPAAPPTGRVIPAGPANYLSKLASLRPGDTLLLAPGLYGVDGQGRDTDAPPGLPLFNLRGTPQAPITVCGPLQGPRPRFLGRSTHNTVRLANAGHLVIRRIEVDGRNLGGHGVATQGPADHITLEDNLFVGCGANQQVVAISTVGAPTWGWVIRRNEVIGAGTGLYLGNSDGGSPFVAGLIEHNLVRDTLGYGLQVKHQVPWTSVPAGMPTGATTTVIRHNVFSKSGNSSTGAAARPNLLLGDQPASGPGALNGFAVYGNFFFQNPSEALFQAEGRFAFYDNLLVTDGPAAMRVQRHNGVVREVQIFHNTVVCAGNGISVEGGTEGSRQRVFANAVFSDGPGLSVTGSTSMAHDNLTDTLSNAAALLVNPLATIGSLDLYPRSSAMRAGAVNLSALSGLPDWNRDFNGQLRDGWTRGAYEGIGTNPGWRLALAIKP